METATQKQVMSAILTKDQHRAFMKYVKSFLTKEACRKDLGVNIKTLNNLIFLKRASPATVEMVLLKIPA